MTGEIPREVLEALQAALDAGVPAAELSARLAELAAAPPAPGRKRSKVLALPGPVLAEVNRLLNAGVILDDILRHLRRLGVPAPDLPSRSGLGRYKQQLEEVGERLRHSRQVAEALVGRLGEAPEGRQARLNIELMHSIVMDLLSGGDLDAEQAMLVARSLKDLATAAKADADHVLRLRRELAAQLEEEKKRKAAEAATEARQRGMSDEQGEWVRAQILGVTLPEAG